MKRMTLSLLIAFLLTSLLIASAMAEDSLFSNPEVNAMIDENYLIVQKEGWAELRIPESLHGIGAEQFSPNVLDAAHKLIDAGYEAYVIGGAVRDLVMGTETSDFDLVSNASYEVQESLLGDMTFHISGTGLKFGFLTYPDEVIDMATCLNIPAYYEGLPNIPEFDTTTPYSDSFVFDSFERDLTFNAIYYDVRTGELVDYHGGLHDIREGIIDTMADAEVEFSNNQTASIRALRFKARYGYTFSDRVEAALRAHAPEYAAEIIPGVLDFNIKKFYPSGYARAGYDVLMDYDVFPVLYPPLADICQSEAYIAWAQTATEWMDAWHDAGNELNEYFSTAVMLWPAVEDCDPIFERITEIVDAENALVGMYDDEYTHIVDVLELQAMLATDIARADAASIVERPEFEDAYQLLLIRAEADDTLGDLADFWTQVRTDEAALAPAA